MPSSINWAAEAKLAARASAEAEARYLAAVKARLKAEATANRLLRQVIGAAEYRRYRRLGCVRVPSRSRPAQTYLVFPDCVEIAAGGKAVGSICIYVQYVPDGSLPEADQILTLVLMARYQEKRLRSVGNLEVYPQPLPCDLTWAKV